MNKHLEFSFMIQKRRELIALSFYYNDLWKNGDLRKYSDKHVRLIRERAIRANYRLKDRALELTKKIRLLLDSGYFNVTVG